MKKKFYKLFYAAVLLFSTTSAFAQPVLNEIYTTPGGSCNSITRTEFFEIYNGNQGGGNAVANLGCYYLVSRWVNGAGGANNEGFYVLDFPANATVNAGGFFTAAPVSNPATQVSSSVTCGFTPSLVWNNGGVTTNYTWNGTTYVASPVTNLMDMFPESAPFIAVMLYNGTTFVDGFIGGNGGNVASTISTVNAWPSLHVNVNCSGVTSTQTINFSSIVSSDFDYVGQAAGSNNGYARVYDGNCGAWQKASSAPYHTPNATNQGAITGTDTYWNVSYSTPVFVSSSLSTVNASLSAIQNTSLLHVSVYTDINANGTYDAGIDPQYGTTTNVSVGGTTLSIPNINLPGGVTCFVLIRADNNCFYTQNTFTTSAGPLPVGLKNFYASRKSNTVVLNWQTAFEQNAAAFEIERNTGNGFVNVGQVTATNNSNGSTYSFNDNNAVKAISQYRLKMVDKDGKFQYSEIRSVKGLNGVSDFTVYPNPSNGNAKVTISDISEAMELQVIDNTGRTLKKYTLSNSSQVELSGLSRGMYMIRLVNNVSGESIIKKLTVNN